MMITIKKPNPASQTSRRALNISEWNDEVKAFVKDLTAFEFMVFRGEFQRYCNESKSSAERADAAVSLAVMAIVGEDGQPLFTPEQIPELKEASFKPVTRLMAMLIDPDSKDDSLVKN